MDEKRMIKFKFSLGQNDYVVEWPWTDYMSLTYVLHNPSETNILNQGLVKVTQIRQGYFSLSLENENTTFSVAEQAVRYQLSKQSNLEYKYFCASSYPTLLEIINSCELFLTKQVYAEQQGDTIYIAFDKTVLKALDSIIGELFNSSSEDGSSLLFAGRTSPVPTADGSRIAALDSGSADAEKESMGASIGATSDEVEEGGKPTQILVSGVPPRVDSDYLEMFFENTKKHGGGPVANVELNQEDGVAIVEFEKPDAVDVVLQNQRSKPITMTGVEIRVEAYTREEPGNGLIGGDGPTLKILVIKIPERAVDEEYLEMFFERKGGAVVNIQMFEEFSAAVVEFDDAEAVVSVTNQPLKMFKTEVEVLPYNPKNVPRDTIEVRGQDMHSDVLEMYFESERRSNGGPIEKLHFNKDGDVAYITFGSEDVARRVADKDSHTIARQQLLVEMHQYSDPLTHFLRRNCGLDDVSKQLKHENHSKTTTKDTHNLGAQPQARAEDDTGPPSAAAARLQDKLGSMGKQDMASAMDYSDSEDLEASMFNVMTPGHVPRSHQVTHSRAQHEQDGHVTSSQTPQTGTQHQQQQQQQPQTGTQQQQQQPQTGTQHQQQQQQPQTGDQPDGSMRYYMEKYKSCTGYEGCGIITIMYRFPSGIQQENHPAPGNRYEGIQRNAYLPNNRQGNIVLEMLKVAWERKLVFTIGTFRTAGQEGVITWNDIHHKTNMTPHGKFGYPDPEYLQRVTEELGVKGVKEEDIPEDRWRDIRRRFPNRR